MKPSQRKLEEITFVERALGGAVICGKCAATLSTFADVCTADLREMCPGFLAIEQAKTNFANSKKEAN